MTGFQKQVNLQQAPAVIGDFASQNPRAAVVSPEGQFKAGVGGVNVGTFVWLATDSSNAIVNSGTGKPLGFIHREQQALITIYLAESGLNVPAGFGVTVMRTGDYWFKAAGAAAVAGQKVFASLTDGSTKTGAAGATISGYIETDFVVAVASLTDELAVMSL